MPTDWIAGRVLTIKAARSYEHSLANDPLVPRHIPERSTQPHSHESLKTRTINIIRTQKITK